jgi:hypothetical protein
MVIAFGRHTPRRNRIPGLLAAVRNSLMGVSTTHQNAKIVNIGLPVSRQLVLNLLALGEAALLGWS